MSLPKKMYYRAASLLPIALLKQMQPGILLPYQHLVSDENVRHVRHLYPYKNSVGFTRDLDYLLSNFRPLDPGELIQAVRAGRALPRNSFLLSFDDGLRETYEIIAPLLLQKGVPAIFFLNPVFLDNKALFYRNKLSLVIDKMLYGPLKPGAIGRLTEIIDRAQDRSQGRPRDQDRQRKRAPIKNRGIRDKAALAAAILSINYLNREVADELGECLDISFDQYLEQIRPYLLTGQVKEMVVKGFHFGAHSMDHPNYKLLGLEEQLTETRESCRLVKEEFDLSYSVFSFPHEDAPIGQVFFDALGAEKFSAPDILFGTQNQKIEEANRVFHRFNAERPDYPIEGLIKGLLLYNSGRQAAGGLRVVRPVPTDEFG